jgi:RimJ/RimL family protein N-acetyltransferase
MGFGWEGEKVRLVPLDLDRHLENAVNWMNDPEATQWLAVGDLPMTRLAEREWFERNMKSEAEDVSFAIETLESRHIGFSQIFRIDWRNGVGSTGTLIGDPEDRGKGYGSDAARVRARYAFDVLNLRLLISGAFDGNAPSLKMLRNAGYRECGRIPRRHWKRGAYRDEILMVLERGQ